MAQILSISLHLLADTANFLFGIDPIGEKIQTTKNHAQLLSMRFM